MTHPFLSNRDIARIQAVNEKLYDTAFQIVTRTIADDGAMGTVETDTLGDFIPCSVTPYDVRDRTVNKEESFAVQYELKTNPTAGLVVGQRILVNNMDCIISRELFVGVSNAGYLISVTV